MAKNSHIFSKEPFFLNEESLLETFEFFAISHSIYQRLNFLSYITLSTQFPMFYINKPFNYKALLINSDLLKDSVSMLSFFFAYLNHFKLFTPNDVQQRGLEGISLQEVFKIF